MAGGRGQARHFAIPGMPSAYDHLRNSPLARWAAQKGEQTTASIAEKAEKHGLVFGHSTTINGGYYSVSCQGKVLKTGPLSIISWFIDKYAENPSAYR